MSCGDLLLIVLFIQRLRLQHSSQVCAYATFFTLHAEAMYVPRFKIMPYDTIRCDKRSKLGEKLTFWPRTQIRKIAQYIKEFIRKPMNMSLMK